MERGGTKVETIDCNRTIAFDNIYNANHIIVGEVLCLNEIRIHIDTISTEKMNVRVINYYPDIDSKGLQDIEKRLFEIFKKHQKEKDQNH